MDVKSSLTYKQMQDGMIILSAIRQITNLSLQIEFPGLTFGQVRITSISDAFNTYLKNNVNEVDANDPLLRKMFSVGSFVPAKIMKIGEGEKGYKVEASINPKDVNSNKRHNFFKKGMLMWASVQSELDHGYQLSNGVKNCNIFLPSKNIDDDIKYKIGQPLWCVVHKCDENQNSSILRVSTKWEHINKAKQEDLDSLYNLIPGMQVQLFVDKVTRNGLVGKFLDDYQGYVDQTQLKTPLHLLSKVREGSLLDSYVLYVEPTTNIVHLSLRGLEPVPPPKYDVGHITVAEVIGKSAKGLFVKLGKDEKGFITNKRLLKTLPTKSDSNLEMAIQKKYPQGSRRHCRIIDFNHLERMYICTFETEIVKERLFTTNDVTVGETVTGAVDEVKPDGLILCAGHIRGFVPNMHTSNAKYSEQIKKKFTVGTQVTARVWNVSKHGNIIFTLKRPFIDSDLCLSDVSKADKNQMYPGMVIQLRESGVLVAFYNSLMGWITTKQLTTDLGGHVDPRRYFYQGQVVPFRFVGIKNGRMQLSTQPKESKPSRKRKNSDQPSECDTSKDEAIAKKKKKKSRKDATDQVDEPKECVEQSSQDEDNSEPDDIVDVNEQEEFEDSDEEQSIEDENISSTTLVMPGVEDYFSAKKQAENSEESSSDEEMEEEKKKKMKKAPTRAELAENEERIRLIEKELAECQSNPKSADHFERILLAEPNSSEWWLKYMAFQISNMELDKARTVVKRALETIDMTLLQEKLNVWIARLHLENMHGTKETFDKTFEDALKYNEPIQIYLKTIEMLAEAGKTAEMEAKIKQAKQKFKKSPQMWETIGKVYYMQNNYKEARNCKHLAIKSIEDKKTQLNMIVRFAIMEFRYGEEDVGSQIFETILLSDPRKVNIWITYVDQLTKKGRIDLARLVLERSICQKLPVKSMKTLFTKFRTFEQKHGTPENVEKVKLKAVEYIEKVTV